MQVIPLSKFRTNQTATLLRAIQGESVFLTSRIGVFRLFSVRRRKNSHSNKRGLE